MSRWTPSVEYGSPSPAMKRILWTIWGALFLLAVAAQPMGTWRTHRQFHENATFGTLGLTAFPSGTGTEVYPVAGVEQVAGVEPGSTIAAIDGRPVPETAPIDAIAPMLAGGEGTIARLTLQTPDGSLQTHALMRRDKNREQAQPASAWVLGVVVLPLMGAITAILGLYAAALLMWRRSDSNFAILLAFGLVALVLSDDQPANLFLWLGAGGLLLLIGLLAFPVLIMVLPAFPDGRYSPAWSRWLRLAPFGFVAIAVAASFLPSVEWAIWPYLPAIAAISVYAVFRRYRTSVDRRERQQLKWAAFGFVFGLPLIFASEQVAALATTGPLRDASFTPALLVGATLTYAIGVLLIPLGILMSLNGVRLNDADAAISRSAGYAIVTVLIAAVWAGSTAWMNRFISELVTPGMSASLSALLAAALFVPAREKVLKWTETKLQPALVRLRGLPAKINPLMHDHSPNDLAVAALAAIAQGVQAQKAAIVASCEDGRKLLAAYQTDAAAVIEEFAHDPDADDDFPIHIELSDLCGEVGTLLVGRRTDGCSYNADQRAALNIVRAPLAEALRATSRRASRNAALAAAVAAIEARVGRLEGTKPDEPPAAAGSDEPSVVTITGAPSGR